MKSKLMVVILYLGIYSAYHSAAKPKKRDAFSKIHKSLKRTAWSDWETKHFNVYKSYQKLIYCNPVSSIKSPKNVKELQEIIHLAMSNGHTVKGLGNCLSITDIICTDGIPISMRNINYTVDNNDGTATFGAGIEVKDALEFLQARNKSLIHLPAFAGITIGGAIGTGAHGSSLLHPTSISDQVVRLTIMDGTGNIQKISRSDDLNAFRVHLGLLGIIIDVTVQTVPLFKMTVENKVHPESILLDGSAFKWAKLYDFYEMWWFPSLKEVVVSQGINTWDLSTPGNATTHLIPELDSWTLAAASGAYESLQFTKNQTGLKALESLTKLSLYTSVIGKPAIFSEDGGDSLKNPATGFAWRLMSNKCLDKCVWDNENSSSSIYPEESAVAFELSELPRVINTIKNVLTQIPAAFSMIGVFIRFSRASNALMAISSGRPTVTLEWTTPMRHNPFKDPKDGIGAYQAILQAMIHNHGGRPHWGKNGLFYFSPEILRKTTPNRLSFINAMKRFDPNGLFLNKLGRRILGVSNKMDIDPNVKHCALQDYCICRSNGDCASSQICYLLNGFPVCRFSDEL